ncbi:vWA domain-containing protein [Methanobrevibacter arboriphilus]|uniref:hypothetical protein n=1 Tax=Methanobrevibacter arboriphilus TaxID=39441 RepID=UPI000AB66187|nr:hypothetical protein [Methanobrevibacter arboriphilus]
MARKLLPSVSISDEYFEIIARLTRNLGVEGHRNDITILKTAKAIAAFNNHWKVTMDDLEESILLVLGEINECDNNQIQNQIQQAQSEMNQEENSEDSDDDENSSQNQDSSKEDDSNEDIQDDNSNEYVQDNDLNEDNGSDNSFDNNIDDNLNDLDSEDNLDENDEDKSDGENNEENNDLDNPSNDDYNNENQLQGEVNDSDKIDDEYQMDYNENKSEKEINEFDLESLEKDIRKMLVMEGREKEKFYGSRVNSKSEKGKYVKSKYSPNVSNSDIAIDATIRAAIKSKTSKNTELNKKNALKVDIKNEDIREKVRKHKARASIALVVDMSGSMLAEKKVNKIRGILERIIRNVNRNRDKLTVIGFKGRDSEVIIPSTKRPSSFFREA